ncbi:MAG: UbiA family prenyltransferase, partial [Planctomycetota bacterium]|nr:UbiA family prenyltransferase [Planctomycetota bacterium]
MRPYLELCRIYLVPTALADSFAGFALASVVFQKDEAPIPALLVALMSLCLYSAGMASNDLFDLEKDREGAPQKPLPSGAIAPRHAAWLAAGLAGLALGLGFLCGNAFWPAGLVILFALLYNSGAKKIPVLGDVLMGWCRSGNFLVGATAAAGASSSFLQVISTVELLAPALILGVFISVVTAVSRLEDTPYKPRTFAALVHPLLLVPVIMIAMNPGSWLNWIANLVLAGLLFRAILLAAENQEEL